MNSGSKSGTTRRAFLGAMATTALAAGATPHVLSASGTRTREILSRRRYSSPNDQIQLALIGAGGMGNADVDTALEVPGVKLVAACDCYTGRLEDAREKHGEDLFTTRDFREILGRDDVDAVILATPDHWHARISAEALRAGKAVYCEKPMVHSIPQEHEVIRTQKETGTTFQVGSQGMSSATPS